MTCVFVQGAACGISFSVGVFFVEWLDSFEQTHDVTAWVGSLNTGLMFAGGKQGCIYFCMKSKSGNENINSMHVYVLVPGRIAVLLIAVLKHTCASVSTFI